MIRIFNILWQNARGMFLLALFAGVITGASNTAIIGMINTTISNRASVTPQFIGIFIGLVCFLPIGFVVAQFVLAHFSQKVLYDLRMSLVAEMLEAPLRKLEELGNNKLLATLTNDVSIIANTMVMVPMLLMQITVLCCCLSYLSWLYWPAAIGVLIAMVLGLGAYYMLEGYANKHFKLAREEVNHLYGHFESLSLGTKELMLNQRRQDTFINKVLKGTASRMLRFSRTAAVFFAAAASLSRFIFFAVVGLYVFMLPVWAPNISTEVLTGYTIVLLYLLSPLELITNIIPMVANASISLTKIDEIGASLKKARVEPRGQQTPMTQWQSLEVVNLTHAYHLEHEDIAFTLGPINLAFKPGEMVFLVGGNGSGKTTLAKLILGLYLPENGHICLDGKEITNENRAAYRQLFSAVFVDFYLFDTLLGMEGEELDKRADQYLKMLLLNNKVKIENGKLNTTNLSQGQRKRLSLLVAYLEDRPIYLFDEWAADQDPAFKKFFYRQMLPDLKARGKTIIVISHDDAYYDVADRIIRLDYGQVHLDQVLDENSDLLELFAKTHRDAPELPAT